MGPLLDEITQVINPSDHDEEACPQGFGGGDDSSGMSFVHANVVLLQGK